MTRWTVRKEHGMFWDEDDELCDGPRWHVTSPTGVSWGNYATHTEAMSRADRQARTVQVEIPREPHRAGRYTLRSHQAGIQLRHKKWPKKRGEMTIAHTDVKDLALALLAHHYKQDQA